MKYLLLLLPSLCFAQDWSRHESRTFSPPVQIVVPQIEQRHFAPPVLPKKQPWELTAKDYPKLYLPPKVGVFATPPNIGETRGTRSK